MVIKLLGLRIHRRRETSDGTYKLAIKNTNSGTEMMKKSTGISTQLAILASSTGPILLGRAES